jgi:PAS domain S-box-containing protein
VDGVDDPNVNRDSPILRYGVAILASVIAIAISVALDPLLAGQPFQVMLAAVLISAWFGGLWPALLATALNAIVLDYFFLAPRYAFGIATLGAATRLAMFLAVSLLISSLNDRLRGAYRSAEAARREVEDLANIVASSDDAIVGVDLAGRITSWNQGAERLFGHRENEVVGGSASLLLPAGHAAELPRLLEALSRGGRLGHFETSWITKSGRHVLVSVRLSPTLDGKGRIVGASIIARDVGSQREGELAASRLAAIVASAEEAILAKTLDGTIVAWNPAAERLYGYPASEIVGRSIETIVPEDKRAELARVLERVRAGNRIDNLRTARVRKDGLRIDMTVTIAPVRDSVGNVVGASAVARVVETDGDTLLEDLLRDLAAQIAEVADKSAIERVVATLRRHTDADRVALLRWDDASGMLVPIVSAPAGLARPVLRGQGAVGRAFDEGRPVIGTSGPDGGPGRQVAVPIVRGHRVLAVVAVTFDRAERSASTVDARLTEAAAEVLAPLLIDK